MLLFILVFWSYEINKVEEVRTQQGELELVEVIAKKEEWPDPKGKAPLFEPPTETLPQTKVSKDATNVASMSDDLLKPSSVDWLIRDPLT